MAEYKPKPYTSKTINYDTRIPAKNLDTRVKFFKPLRPIKDIPALKTYDTKPPTHIKVRTYKVKTYDHCTEYVPPWSRGKEKGKTKQPPPKPTPKPKPTEKNEKDKDIESDSSKAKVTFASLPSAVEKEPSLPALGSVKRMMDLFYV